MTDMASTIIDKEIHELQVLSSLGKRIKYVDCIDLLIKNNKVLGKNLYKFSLFKCQN
jgi:hypothetical protein